MACVVGLAALLLAAVARSGDAPWAESPALLEKATDPSFSAVLSAEEVLHRSFDIPNPRLDGGVAASPGEWRWFSRSIPTLDPGLPDSFWHAALGNEIGDHMFQEYKIDEQENRNPFLFFDVSAPLGKWTRTGIRFDQVDHFSNRLLATRLNLTNTFPQEDGSPGIRRAYFGGNRPGHSFLEASITSLGPTTLSTRSGWIWLPSPGAGELQCWSATTVAGAVDAGRIQWRHAHGRFDRADTAHGSIEQFQGWLIGDSFGDSILSARASLGYSSIERAGDVSWQPHTGFLAQPRLDVSFRHVGWHIGGSHQQGTAYFLHSDTLGWSTSGTPWSASLSASGSWTDRPDGTAPWRDSSSAGIVRMEARALEQTYTTGAELTGSDGTSTLTFSTKPWWIVHPRAFVPDSYAVFASSGDFEWIVRSGSDQALDGILWGWKSSLGIDAKMSEFLRLAALLRFDPILGGPEDRIDLVPPLWAGSAGVRLGHRSGFSIHPNLVWRDESILRHRSREDWIIPAGFDANLWIDQSYFEGRLVLSMAALNILSGDRIQVPNGGEDRFRILVRMSGRVF